MSQIIQDNIKGHARVYRDSSGDIVKDATTGHGLIEAAVEIEVLRDIAKNRHNHLILMLDASISETRILIKTAYCEYGDLITKMSTMNSIKVYVINGIMRQIVSAVSHMHSLGWAHCDLSPENVLMKTNSEIPHCVVFDFGHSRRITDKTHSILGKPFYRGPEAFCEQTWQSMCGSWDKQDSFALGVLMYGVITKLFPFETLNFDDPCWNNLKRNNKDAPPLSDIPHRYRGIFYELTRENPQDRTNITDLTQSFV